MTALHIYDPATAVVTIDGKPIDTIVTLDICQSELAGWHRIDRMIARRARRLTRRRKKCRNPHRGRR